MTTRAWDRGPLPPGVRVADDVRFERHDVTFRRYRSERDVGLDIGPGVRIHTWTEFSIEPEGRMVVGARSVLVGATIMCAERIEIGRDVVISYDVTIADCDFHPLDPELRKQDAIANSPFGDVSQRPRLVTPTEKLLRTYPVAARDLRHRRLASTRLRDDPRLGIRRPAPTPARTGDHLDPTIAVARTIGRRSVLSCQRHCHHPVVLPQGRQVARFSSRRAMCRRDTAYFGSVGPLSSLWHLLGADGQAGHPREGCPWPLCSSPEERGGRKRAAGIPHRSLCHHSRDGAE